MRTAARHPHTAHQLPDLTSRVLKAGHHWLPRGNTLPEHQWQLRHRGLTALLWIHVPVVTAVGFATGSGTHVLLESSAIAVFALVASSGFGTRTIRSMSTTVGLMTSSALLVQTDAAR